MLASYLRHGHDPDHGSYYKAPGWPEDSKDDWPSISTSYRANWSHVQLVSNMRKSDVFISECRVHSDVEGYMNSSNRDLLLMLTNKYRPAPLLQFYLQAGP